MDLFPAPADLQGESLGAEGCDLSWSAADYEGYAALRNGGLDFKGYNVYRNGKKLNSSALTETSFHDPEYTENASYTVTALYKQGESGVAGPLLLNKSGVGAVSAAVCARGLKGAIEVAGAAEPVSVYDLQGRLIYKDSETRISVSAGIYIVNVNDCNVKVIVK